MASAIEDGCAQGLISVARVWRSLPGAIQKKRDRSTVQETNLDELSAEKQFANSMVVARRSAGACVRT
ncbi:MAG: hypothetical protein ACT4O5_14390 [Gammaproteobacteria bacterium]